MLCHAAEHVLFLSQFVFSQTEKTFVFTGPAIRIIHQFQKIQIESLFGAGFGQSVPERKF